MKSATLLLGCVLVVTGCGVTVVPDGFLNDTYTPSPPDVYTSPEYVEDIPADINECSNSCEWAFDDVCDDGGSGAEYDTCVYGTDCADCGYRNDETVAFTYPDDGYWFVYMGSAQDLIDGYVGAGDIAAVLTIAQGEVVWFSFDGANGMNILDEATNIGNGVFGAVILVSDNFGTATVEIWGDIDFDGNFGYTTFGAMSIDAGGGPIEISVRGRQI